MVKAKPNQNKMSDYPCMMSWVELAKASDQYDPKKMTNKVEVMQRDKTDLRSRELEVEELLPISIF